MPLPSNRLRLTTSRALSGEDCRLLVESVIDYAIFMLDIDGRVATWSRGAERIYGYCGQDIIGQAFAVLCAPDDAAAQQPQQALEAAGPHERVEKEAWRLRKDGSKFWASVVITAMREPTGLLRGFGVVVRDLTDRFATEEQLTRDLTARRRAEDALRQSEERFRLLVENVAEYAIYMLDPEGRVTTWNLGAERMKGYSAAEILGRNFACFFPAEDVARGKPELELELARVRGRFEDEGWRVRKDGKRFWANAVLTAVHDHNGILIGFAKITRDLTGRRQEEEAARHLLVEQTAREVAERSEAELRSSQEENRALNRRLEIVLEGVADGITVEDRAGRLVFANAAAGKIWGFSSGSELTRASVADIAARFEALHADGQPFQVEDFPTRRVFAGVESPHAVLHVRDRSSQRDWWLLVRAGAVLDAAGQPDLAISIWHDITAQRRHEAQAKYLGEATAALGSSLVRTEMLETLARILVPGMGDWCSIYLLEGEQLREAAVAHADPAKAQLVETYGSRYPPTREHAGSVWSVIHSGAPAVFNEFTEETLRTWTTDPDALQILRAIGMTAALIVPIRVRHRVIGALSLACVKPGCRYDESDVALIEELGRRTGVAVENAQLFEAAQDALNRAEEAGRAKDEFLAIVSHELRTPLSAILGWSTLLKDRIKDPTTAKPIQVIHRNAKAQVKLIDDILDVSRVITGKFRLEPKPMDLVAVAREALEVVLPSAEAKRIELQFTHDEDYCLLVADPERLQQVIWNLLSNAIKFTEPGGHVKMTLRHEPAQVVIVVEDNGRGIEPAFVPLVFDRFRQAESATTRRMGGLGLGLALVRHITELHGGRASAASAGLGRGAAFTVTLPHRATLPVSGEVRPISEREPGREGSVSLAPLHGVRVLVVDDEPDACELVAMVLAQTGAQVQTARSAAEGFQAFQRFHPDVLISDIGMPEEDGYSLIRRIRALETGEGGRVPAVALTAFSQEEDRARALSAGFTSHVRKPVEPTILTDAVANLAMERSPE